MLLCNKIIKNKILIICQNKCWPQKQHNKKFDYLPKKMWVRKTTQYGGDVVVFLPNKIIKNKKLNYPQKNVGLAHGNNRWFYCTWFMRALHMVLKPCVRPTIFCG